MRLLLHTCCAPCSCAIIEALLAEGVRPTVYFCNPNIFPREEYECRKGECIRYCKECGVDFVDADYNHEMWLQCIAGHEEAPERGSRCTECFKHRLLSSAQYAVRHGFDTLATTLASSRWKNLDQVNAAGRWAVDTVLERVRTVNAYESARRVELAEVPCPPRLLSENLVWYDRNWRKGGLQDRRNQLIREKAFYNQQYCGCEFSVRGGELSVRGGECSERGCELSERGCEFSERGGESEADRMV